jgi:hypothetical protein
MNYTNFYISYSLFLIGYLFITRPARLTSFGQALGRLTIDNVRVVNKSSLDN